MSFLKSLPIDAGLLEIHKAFPESARPFLQYQEALLRGESPFSAAERELIAAYVSGLNNCDYCYTIHSQIAVALGIPANTIDQIFANAENANVDPKIRPVLAFARKVTFSPAKITSADTDAIFAAGWNDRAMHDAVAICSLFNLLNRFVNGLGVQVPDPYTRMVAQWVAKKGYAQSVEFLPASK
jgi:uncharacterized peroxidase-related enzyme